MLPHARCSVALIVPVFRRAACWAFVAATILTVGQPLLGLVPGHPVPGCQCSASATVSALSKENWARAQLVVMSIHWLTHGFPDARQTVAIVRTTLAPDDDFHEMLLNGESVFVRRPPRPDPCAIVPVHQDTLIGDAARTACSECGYPIFRAR